MNIRRAFIVFVPVFVVVFGGIGIWRGADSLTGQIYLGRGSELASQGKYQQAFADYDRALDLDPDLSEAVALGNAQIYTQEGHYNAALAAIRQALAVSPRDSMAYVYRATVHLGEGDYQAAVLDCNEAISIRPDLASAYFAAGTANADLHQSDKAIQDFSVAVVLSASVSKAEAYAARGKVYGSSGNPLQAINDFDSAIELQPKNAYYYYDRALSLRDVGNNSQALADLKKVLSLTTDPQLVDKANQQIKALQNNQSP